MRLLASITFALLLTGCATEITQSPYGNNYFEIRQHFSNGSEFDANSMAQSRCLMQNSIPKLVNVERGGMLSGARGGEFHLYTYQCISNQSIAEDRQTYDANSCSNWGFTKGTEGYANCMMRLYEVRIAVDNAAATNREIRNMTEQQRRAAERDQAYKLLNLNMQFQQQLRPQTITPFTCNKMGNFVSCQ
jgi:hypothetical protein